MRNHAFYFLVIAFILSPSILFAQTDESSLNHIDLRVNFFIKKSIIDMEYCDNGVKVSEFLSKVDSMVLDSTITFVAAKIIGSASPDGDMDSNYELSKARASAIKTLVNPHINLQDQGWEFEYKGADWEGLEQMISNSDIEDAEKIVQIIRETPIWVKENGVIVGGRKKSLMNLNGGRSWHEMEKKLFPELRMTTLKLYYSVAPEKEAVEPEPLQIVHEPEPEVEEAAVTEQRCILALKTNGLYDLCLAPTIGIEVPFAGCFSVSAEWTYAWWSNQSSYFYRTYGGDLSFRWWFGKSGGNNSLLGHHIGVYGQMFTFDFMFNKKGIIAPDWNFAAGIEYGYSIPLAKNLHMDFGLGIGHVWGEYSRYQQIIIDESSREYLYQKIDTQKYPAVLPTKAEVSLIWLIK